MASRNAALNELAFQCLCAWRERPASTDPDRAQWAVQFSKLLKSLLTALKGITAPTLVPPFVNAVVHQNNAAFQQPGRQIDIDAINLETAPVRIGKWFILDQEYREPPTVQGWWTRPGK